MKNTFNNTFVFQSQLNGLQANSLLRPNNLSDLTNVSAARTNLGVYSKTEVDNVIATINTANFLRTDGTSFMTGSLNLARQNLINGGNVSFTTGQVSASPVNPTDLVNLQYVNTVVKANKGKLNGQTVMNADFTITPAMAGTQIYINQGTCQTITFPQPATGFAVGDLIFIQNGGSPTGISLKRSTGEDIIINDFGNKLPAGWSVVIGTNGSTFWDVVIPPNNTRGEFRLPASPSASDNSTKIATTEYVNTVLSSFTTTPVYFSARLFKSIDLTLTQLSTILTGLTTISSSGSEFSNSRFTAPVKGIYLFLTYVNGFVPDDKLVAHRADPSQSILNPIIPVSPMLKSAPALLILNAGDYVDITLQSADATPSSPVSVTLFGIFFQGVLIQRLP